MSLQTKLWLVRCTTSPDLAEIFSEVFAETAQAVTVLAPPRSAKAKVEAIFDFEPDPRALNAQISIIAVLHKTKAPKIEIEEMPKLDWLKKVAEDFPPLPIARWTVHGRQHRDKVPDRRYALQIDATNAFGTGEHPTTRGCLLMLDWVLKNKSLLRHSRECGNPSPAGDIHGEYPRWTPAYAGVTPKKLKMLDMGCGSGILAMAFLQATRGKAVAVDMDADSIVIARDNAAANGLSGAMRTGISVGYNSALVRNGKPYDLIMSNIFAKPLCHMAKDLRRHLRPGGMVILSGILQHQANMVLAAHRMQKLYLVKQLRIGEWAVLLLKRAHRLR